MCGIVGYVGPREAAAVLVVCLSRLEYRGYDSAGLAVLNGRGVETRKLAGRIEGLRALVTREPLHGRCGIGHTRRRSEEHTSELQSLAYLVCRLLLEKKNTMRGIDRPGC